MDENTKNTLAILSLVFSLLAWAILAIVLAPLSVVFGAIGCTAKQSWAKTLGILGLCIGSFTSAITIISLMAMAIMG